MWRQIILVLPLTLSTLAIRVPVDGTEENKTDSSEAPVSAEKKQDTFYITDQGDVDSYLIPPDPHRPAEVIPEIIVTPATYLLPPSPEKQIDYYAPTEAGDQTDWYPIAQVPLQSTPLNLLPQRPSDVIPIFISNNQTFEIKQNPRSGKTYDGDRIIIPVPSRQLEAPFEDTPLDYTLRVPSEELELPVTETYQPFYIPQLADNPAIKNPILKTIRKNHKKPLINHGFNHPVEPTIALHLTPPKLVPLKNKKPTKLYPKKVAKGFQPIPIPISQFAEDSSPEVPRAKPLKPLRPESSDESEYFTPSDEKMRYLYEQANQKRKLKEEGEVKQQPAIAAEDTYGVNVPAEQETSETNYKHPSQNIYSVPHYHSRPIFRPQPIREAPAPIRNEAPLVVPPPGERTEFRMHGMKGPHSYQFGFDTGKGKNRQFRYEERDNDGHVKGHYGYMDKSGKLRVVNYDADPKTGFHAEAPVEKE